MNITLSPIATDRDSVVTVSGDTLTIDGVPYDLSVIPEGAEATDEDSDSPFIGPIRRLSGHIVCTVMYRYDMTTARRRSRAAATVPASRQGRRGCGSGTT